jgi:integrase
MPKLTTPTLLKYKPGKVRREIPDDGAPGLRLVIQPSGVRSFAMRFRRPSGRPAKLTLGRLDTSGRETSDDPQLGGPLTLRQARELATRIDRERARGIDVVAAYQAEKSRRLTQSRNAAENTFGRAAVEFFIDYKTKWNDRPRRWRSDARLLGLQWPEGADPSKTEPVVMKGSLSDTWRERPVGSIDSHDVHAAVDESRKLGIPGLKRRGAAVSDSRGRKMHAALSTLFSWLLRNRRVTLNPSAGVWRPALPLSRDRTLTAAELVAFWRAADTLDAPFHAAALKLMLLTGARRGEVSGMRREELHADGTWHLPATRTKNHRPHVVPLPPLTLEILAAVPRVEGDFVFTLTGKAPITGWSKIKKELDRLMPGLPPWRLHDLRRTCATEMVELGILPHVVEAVLNHISGAKAGVAGTYNRSELMPERKAALLRWAQHVAGLVSGKSEKVVALRQ